MYNMTMKMDVKHIAKLANLPLTENEYEKFGKQLRAIIDYIDQLKKVDITSVTETSQVTGLTNRDRIDKTTDSFSQEEALSQTKSKHNGLFCVPVIIEEAVET